MALKRPVEASRELLSRAGSPVLRSRLVALFVAFHIAAVGVLSIPPPPPGLRGDDVDPDTEAALAAWVGAFGAVGLPEAGTERLIRAALPLWGRFLRGVRAPFAPYAALTGAEQSWRMFGTVPDRGARFEVDLRVNGRWTPLYRPQAPIGAAGPSWQARLLGQERMRAELHRFEGHRAQASFETLATHLADLARRDVERGALDGDGIRVWMRRVRIPDPGMLRRTGRLVDGAPYWGVERAL